MIRINNLTKIYKSKRRSRCKALDNINLTLPNKGLVFVLGKSGSGKSTLLNLIGGLDNITKGSIIVDGNNISYFNEKEFCDYRNTHIGFIFQDYHLIDELTVYDNICLSLNLRRIEDRGLVRNALKRVDLAGYEDRYPSELSGGERQRVAIARAIVKKPRIILADEPTGNLDTYTSTSIIKLLKELSKECLILIVSHNVNDAYSYSDRIIELSKGKIIKDQSKNPMYSDNVICHNNNIYYPGDKILNDNDISYINSNMNNNSKIIKLDNKYISTSNQYITNDKVDLEKKRLSIFKELGLSLKFLKSKVLRIFFSSFMVSVIMVILALSQTIITFDSSALITEEARKQNFNSMYFEKIRSEEVKNNTASISCRVPIDSNDIDIFKENGIKDNIYPVYNISIASTLNFNYTGFDTSIFSSDGIIQEALGTMVVDEGFLLEKFGEYKYTAKANHFAKEGIIITDFMADSILSSNKKYKSHEDLIGYYLANSWSMSINYINGIIDTNYEELYSELLKKIANNEFEDRYEKFEDKDFISFNKDVYDRLGYCYSLNSNFIEDYKNAFAWYVPFTQKLIVNDDKEYTRSSAFDNYFVWGELVSDRNMLSIGSYMYSFDAPLIPFGAKYMRVQYGGMQTVINERDNPNAYKLLNNKKAIIEFSDGSSPSDEVLNKNKSCWLNSNGTLHKQTSHPLAVVSDYIEIPEGCSISKFETYSVKNYAFCAFYDENKNFISSFNSKSRVPLKEGEMIMNISKYNELFGTEWTSSTIKDFVPHKVKFTQYRFEDYKNSNPLVSFEATITSLCASGASRVSTDIAIKLSESQIYASGIYINGVTGMATALDLMEELNYEYQFAQIDAIQTMSAAVDVFIPIFELVAIFLCIGIIFILVSFSTKMIKDKMHDIGILKAIGTQSKTIGRIFGLQIILIAILTILMSTFGYYYFIDMANDVLVASLKSLTTERIVLDLDFLTFKLSVVNMNIILILLLGILSLFIPMLKIRKIKPVKIIKTKE